MNIKQNKMRLRRIRSHPALFGDNGPEKEKQAERIRDKLILRLSPHWRESARERQLARFHRAWDADTAMGRTHF